MKDSRHSIDAGGGRAGEKGAPVAKVLNVFDDETTMGWSFWRKR